jgi:hypothetical protein
LFDEEAAMMDQITMELPGNTVNPMTPSVAQGHMAGAGVKSPPRIVRGFRFPVLPSGTLLAQISGGVALLAGTFLQFGGAVTLIVGGAGAALLGALKESGRI